MTAPKPLLLNALASDEAPLVDVLSVLEREGLRIEAAGELDDGGPHGNVLTVWSRASILDERIVRNADLALHAGCLIPIRIEDVLPPIGFRQVQTYDVVQLSEEAGKKLASDLRKHGLDIQKSESPTAIHSTTILLRAIEWACFVTVPVGAFVPAFSWLLGYSNYITFIFAAPIVANTAVTGVPTFLLRHDAVSASNKLIQCGRVDLGLQAILTILFGLFASTQAPNASIAADVHLALRYLAPAAAGLIVRHIAIGMWLIWRDWRSQLRYLARIWGAFIVVPLLVYCSASWFLLHAFFSRLAFIFIATSSVQAIAFGVPGFESNSAMEGNSSRRLQSVLTLSDLLVQAVSATAEAGLWHQVDGKPIFAAVMRLYGCAGIAIIGRYILFRVWHFGIRQTH